MKTLFVLGFSGFSLVALTVGCNKQEPVTPAVSAVAVQAPVPPSEVLKATNSQPSADALKANDAPREQEAMAKKQADADKATQALKQAADDKMAAEQLAAAKQSQLATGAGKVQALIDTAKTLASDNKWSEVLKILAGLAGQSLTPTQQSVVDGLKSNAQKQLESGLANRAATDAGGAIGGLLAPKK